MKEIIGETREMNRPKISISTIISIHDGKVNVNEILPEFLIFNNICSNGVFEGGNPLKRVIPPQTPLFLNFLTKNSIRNLHFFRKV